MKLDEIMRQMEQKIAEGDSLTVIRPTQLKQMVELIRQMAEALHYTNINGFCAEESCHKMEDALAAFERFNGE